MSEGGLHLGGTRGKSKAMVRRCDGGRTGRIESALAARSRWTFPAGPGAILANAEQASQESGLFHRADRSVHQISQRGVAVRAGLNPPVGAAAAEGQTRHGIISMNTRALRPTHTMTGSAQWFPVSKRCATAGRKSKRRCRSSRRFPQEANFQELRRECRRGRHRLAGVTGFEPVALGFGDRCSTN